MVNDSRRLAAVVIDDRERRPLRFPDRAEDETYRRSQSKGCHRLVLHRFVDSVFKVASDFARAGIAQLVHCIACVPFNLSSRLLDLAGGLVLQIRRLVRKV